MRASLIASHSASPSPRAPTPPSRTPSTRGRPAGDRADVVGDGEIIDEPGEPDANVLGDGFTNYDSDADGYINDTEYGTNFGTVVMTDYDTDGDGRVSMAEYDTYRAAHPHDM